MFSDARQKAVSIPKTPKEQKTLKNLALRSCYMFVWRSVHVRTYMHLPLGT